MTIGLQKVDVKHVYNQEMSINDQRATDAQFSLAATRIPKPRNVQLTKSGTTPSYDVTLDIRLKQTPLFMFITVPRLTTNRSF
jgi:hypothetical protein